MSVAWPDIEAAASRMFNVWTSGGDFDIAREAWSHLEAAGLTDDGSPALATESRLRLIALCRIYEGFCAAKWDENPDTPVTLLAEDLEIDRLSLGLLAAPKLEPGDWLFADEFEAYRNALTSAVKVLQPQVHDCLRAAYGGDTGFYQRLSRTRSNSDERDDDDFYLEGGNVDAYAFVKCGSNP
jgi:hypothetical protein